MKRGYYNSTGDRGKKTGNNSKPNRQEHTVARPDFSRKYKEIEDPYGMDKVERRRGPGPSRPANAYVTREQYSASRPQGDEKPSRPKKQRRPVRVSSAEEQSNVTSQRVAPSSVHRANQIHRPARPNTYNGRSTLMVDDEDRERQYVYDSQAMDTSAVAASNGSGHRKLIIAGICGALLIVLIAVIGVSSYRRAHSDAKKTLYFWADCTNDPAMEQYLIDITQAYNSQQDKVKVELKTRFNDYTATITYRYREKTKPNTGSAPDINLVYGQTMKDMLDIGNIYDLSVDMKDAGYNYTAMFEGLMIENVNVSEGAVYALPYMVNTYATVFNVDLFSEIGVNVQDIPCTVEGLLAMNGNFSALSSEERGTVYGLALPTNDPAEWLFTITQIGKAHGVDTFDYSTLTRKYTALTDLVTQLTDSSRIPLKGVGTYEEMVEKFAKGQIAAIMVDYDTLRDKLQQENSKFAIKTSRVLEYLPFVQPEAADLYSVTYVEINKSSNNKEEAYDFLMYLLRNDNMSQLYKDTGNIPANWNSLEYQPPTDQTLESFYAFSNRVRLPEPMGSASEGMTVGEMFVQIRDGLLSPEKALTTLQDQENESIKQAVRSERIKADDYTIYYEFYKE